MGKKRLRNAFAYFRRMNGYDRPFRQCALILWAGVLCGSGCLLFQRDAQAQQASVSGFVTDVTDGQPLELVNVALEQDGQVVRGAATNEDGSYVISGLSPGRYRIEARFVGYRPHTDSLRLQAGAVRTYNILRSNRVTRRWTRCWWSRSARAAAPV